MGLDVSVYQNIKIIESENDDSEEFYEVQDFRAFVINDSWKYKVKNLVYDAYYTGDCVGPDFGYPYSAHMHFRNQLASISGDVYWPNGCDDEKAFFELLYFADNEGCLDWDISEKLYNAFVDNRELAISKLGYDEAFVRRYDVWTEIFKFGKDKGVVVFH